MIDAETARTVILRTLDCPLDFEVQSLGTGRRWSTFLVQCTTGVITDRRWGNCCGWPLPSRWVLRIGTIPPVDFREFHNGLRRSAPGYLMSLLDKQYAAEVWEYVDGVTVAASGAQPDEYLDALCRELRLLHLGRAVYHNQFCTEWWIDRVYDQTEEAIRYHDRHWILEGLVGHRAGWDTLRFALRRLDPVRTSLIHGDLSRANIILDHAEHSKVAGLIDFDTAQYGDYLWDLADWLTFNDHWADTIENVLRLLRLYHGMDDDEAVSPGLWRRLWVYFTCRAVQKLVHLHQLGYQDLTRARARISLGLNHLHR